LAIGGSRLSATVSSMAACVIRDLRASRRNCWPSSRRWCLSRRCTSRTSRADQGGDDCARGRAGLCAALSVLRGRHTALWFSRPVLRIHRLGIAGAGTEDRQWPSRRRASRQWLFRMRNARTHFDSRDDGVYGARRVADGHSLRRARPGCRAPPESTMPFLPWRFFAIASPATSLRWRLRSVASTASFSPPGSERTQRLCAARSAAPAIGSGWNWKRRRTGRTSTASVRRRAASAPVS
jgi:hypothetical protein